MVGPVAVLVTEVAGEPEAVMHRAQPMNLASPMINKFAPA